MSEPRHLNHAAAALTGIVESIEPGQLTAPTPCADHSVRDLLNHLLFWGPSLEGGARKEVVPPPAASESDADLTSGDWKGDVVRQVERTSHAWSTPSAWEGMTHMGSPRQMPAELIGGMITMEFAVHAWDLARATDQDLDLDDDLIADARDVIAKTGDQGRAMGVFGAEVPVPDTAPPLHHLLGETGRNPQWRP
ncbi:TIGR03086 family metal-binding protein [Saccharopolyspora hordei]|uniref:Uncharacterized protein (TIGR03086 family) n=1 Tax=Saccharopolyspora hordei TaxID=1838 RepID=A0A853AAS6_9PSEU|nr:TIGR03086 family metal-binding protein [Saccharopolyspora hordei]NYI81482.1 uncharacterized protein (TIGR03086 family) [Saccharopolyspora hordei]